jgi:hypothetical protein
VHVTRDQVLELDADVKVTSLAPARSTLLNAASSLACVAATLEP